MRSWTDQDRARQSQAIRNWQPWKKSTGPRTHDGKRRTSQNAWKHGGRSRTIRDLKRWLCEQRRYVASLRRVFLGPFRTNGLLSPALLPPPILPASLQKICYDSPLTRPP